MSDVNIKTALEAAEALRHAMATNSRDWDGAADDAWLYGLVVGWGSDHLGEVLPEVAAKHGWTEQAQDRLRELRRGFAAIPDLLRRLAELEDAITWGTECLSCSTVPDSSHRHLERAEKAEAELAAAREQAKQAQAEADAALRRLGDHANHLVQQLNGARHARHRIADAHHKHVDVHGGTYGECNECGNAWPCPTYVWATTDRDPLAAWDPADDAEPVSADSEFGTLLDTIDPTTDHCATDCQTGHTMRDGCALVGGTVDGGILVRTRPYATGGVVTDVPAMDERLGPPPSVAPAPVYAHDAHCNTTHTAGPQACPPARTGPNRAKTDDEVWAGYKDQSYLSRVERGEHVRCHVARPDGTAWCTGDILDDSWQRGLAEVPEHMRCKKRGCKQRWPS